MNKKKQGKAGSLSPVQDTGKYRKYLKLTDGNRLLTRNYRNL